jgi:hypothetical protein
LRPATGWAADKKLRAETAHAARLFDRKIDLHRQHRRHTQSFACGAA